MDKSHKHAVFVNRKAFLTLNSENFVRCDLVVLDLCNKRGMLRKVLNRLCTDFLCLFNTNNIFNLLDKSALLVNSLLNVREGFFDCDNPIHINYFFISFTDNRILALVPVFESLLYVIVSKIRFQQFLHIFVGSIVLTKIYHFSHSSFFKFLHCKS